MKTFATFVLLTATALVSCSQKLTFLSRGINGGGALFFPTINPNNTDEFYFTCDMSQRYHTTDFGKSYQMVPFLSQQVEQNSTYEFTDDPNVAYSYVTRGQITSLFKIIHGTTWTNIADPTLASYGQIYRVCANHKNSSQLLVSTFRALLFSNNGGSTFDTLLTTTDNNQGVLLGGVFWDTTNGYVATNKGFFKLDYTKHALSRFASNVFTKPKGEVIISFSGAQVAGQTKFVCITGDTLHVYNNILGSQPSGGTVDGVYIMDNEDGNWKPSLGSIDTVHYWLLQTGMAQNNSTTIYLGGADNNGNPVIYKSTDGGSSWLNTFNTVTNQNLITGWLGNKGDLEWYMAGAPYGMAVADNDVDKVVFGTNMNIMTTTNGGTSWQQAYVAITQQHPAKANTPKGFAYTDIGLENTSGWQISWLDKNTLLGSSTDIGAIKSIDGGFSWSFADTATELYRVPNVYRIVGTSNGNLYAACSNIHDLYTWNDYEDKQIDKADANGKIVYSSDAGKTWQLLKNFNHPIFWLLPDPGNNGTLYAAVVSHTDGTGGIYRTTNLSAGQSANWTFLGSPPRTEGHPSNLILLKNGNLLCTFSVRGDSNDKITPSSGVFLFDNTKLTWTDLTKADQNNPADSAMFYWSRDIVVDPNDASQQTWYVGAWQCPGHRGGLFKTSNAGVTWNRLTDTLSSVTSITFNSNNMNEAYLTTQNQGLFFSSDMVDQKPLWVRVAAYSFRQPERVFYNPYNAKEIWVTSFGGGMMLGTPTGAKQ